MAGVDARGRDYKGAGSQREGEQAHLALFIATLSKLTNVSQELYQF
jgi:hypothetical protein